MASTAGLVSCAHLFCLAWLAPGNAFELGQKAAGIMGSVGLVASVCVPHRQSRQQYAPCSCLRHNYTSKLFGAVHFCPAAQALRNRQGPQHQQVWGQIFWLCHMLDFLFNVFL